MGSVNMSPEDANIANDEDAPIGRAIGNCKASEISFDRPLVWFALVTQLLLTIAILKSLGRSWWCSLGDYSPIILSATSAHTSQHLVDPYTFTHIAHGFIFCGVLALVAPKSSLMGRWLLAVAAECAWEIFENTPFVIDRYRTATAALGYEGDSIANSLADIVACAAGFAFAVRFGWWITLLVFAGFELFLLITIRDSLVLNILMLCYPVEMIRDWQLGALDLKSS
jgi:hypothetical protein